MPAPHAHMRPLQVEHVADEPCNAPDSSEVLKDVMKETSDVFETVMERSSHLAREIESQYGSRPSDPEVFENTSI